MKQPIKVLLIIILLTLTSCAGMGSVKDKAEGAPPASGY